MTTREMIARLESLPEASRLIVWRMVRDGYGAHGITLESNANLKQANAMFAWKERYGDYAPFDTVLRIAGAKYLRTLSVRAFALLEQISGGHGGFPCDCLDEESGDCGHCQARALFADVAKGGR